MTGSRFDPRGVSKTGEVARSARDAVGASLVAVGLGFGASGALPETYDNGVGPGGLFASALGDMGTGESRREIERARAAIQRGQDPSEVMPE